MNAHQTHIAAALALAGLLGIEAGCSPEAADHGSTDAYTASRSGEQDSKRAATLVRLGRLQLGEIASSIEVSTDIDAEHRVDVYAKVGPAYVKELLVREGDRVAEGDPLLILDDIDFRIAERRKASALAQARQAEKSAQVKLAEAQARERAIKAAYERAKADYERAINAMKGEIEVLSEKEMKDSSAEFEQRKAEYEASTLASEQGVNDLEASRLLREAAEIELEAARIDLANTTVRAQLTGLVQQRDVNVGLLVSSATHLFTLVDPTLLIANLRVPQDDLLRLGRERLPVEFRLDAVPGRVFMGVVEAINPAVDPSSGLVKVRARLGDDAAGALLPGMFARARIVIENRKDAVLLSKRAVVYEEGRTYLFAAEGTVARRHAFRAGASTADEIEVLSIGDGPPDLELSVIVVGQDRLRDGDPIEAAKEVE